MIRGLDGLRNNALRYVDSGGEIEVLCENTGAGVQIIVKESGRETGRKGIERIWINGWQVKALKYWFHELTPGNFYQAE